MITESTYKERLKYFRLVLSPHDNSEDINDNWTPIIDMKAFREACFYGVPDEPGYRSTAWKVLMGYLPPDKRMWESSLKSQRLTYYNWVKDLLEEPGEEPPSRDHPLNADPGSKWASYFQDNSILEQIDKDVRRTLPDFAFFQLHVPQNPLNPLSPAICDNSKEVVHYPETDPLSGLIPEEATADSVSKRFSFGFIGRPRSGSSASRKSLKNLNNNVNNSHPQLNSLTSGSTNTNNTRARSNSRSSVRSFSSGILDSGSDIIGAPRSIVKKLSTAFSSKNNANGMPKIEKKAILNPICPYIPSRRSLFRRIAHLNEEIGNREHQNNGSKYNMGQKAMDADRHVMDYHWEAIERILFIYAKLNPGVGYVQGMNEILAPIYYVFAAKNAENDLESQAYAEADSFFVFTTLMSDVRDHFVRSLDQDASTGINATMWRMSQRLAWLDRSLFRDLSKKDIKEQYYAFRWITVLCSQEWDLPDVIRLWDSILADRGMQEGVEDARFEFLLDFAVAMILCIRQDLIQGDFAENMRILQNYPIDDIHIVLTSAYSIREARLQAIAQGRVIPGVNDKRCSGMFSTDMSDTSSISSTGSGSRLKKLRDTTDMARASLDSLRRGSKESLDDLFRRSLSITRNSFEDIERKRATTGEALTRSLSQKFGFANNLAAKVRRTSSVRSVNSAYMSQQEEKINKDWLLANQINGAEVNMNHGRHSPMSPHASSNNNNRTSSLMNKFSQFVSSKPVVPYQNQTKQDPQFLDAAYSSTLLSDPLNANDNKSQLSNNLNTRESLITSAYRGYV